MRPRRLALFIFVLSALLMLGLWVRNEMKTDRCLDRGGKWDERRQICEGAVELVVAALVGK